MPGGIQDVPLRIPDEWDSVWFAEFVRDVLSKADIRNAKQGAGISITGQSSEVATIAASEDIALLQDQGFILADPVSDPDLLPNSRQLAGEPGIVTITDAGAGGNITVAIQAHGLSYSKLRLGAPLSIVGNTDVVNAELIGITGVDDTVLRRTAGTLGFGTLTLAMANNHLWTYAKIQAVTATSRFLGRITALAGDIEELTGTQATSLLDGFTASLKGLVPPPTTATGRFLKDDGTWSLTPGGGGSATVLSAAILALTPTGYWKMGEASSTFADSSGNGNTLNTLVGTIRYQATPMIPGDSTKFALFEANAGASIAGSLGITVPIVGDWSIHTIGLIATNVQANLFLIGGVGDASATTNEQATLYQDGTSVLAVEWESATGTNQTLSYCTCTHLIPLQYVVVKDSTAKTVALYVNGRLVSTRTYTTEPTGGSVVLTGVGNVGSFTSTGPTALAHVAFFNGVKLTAANALALALAAGFG